MSKDTIYRQDFDKFLEDAEKEAVKNRKYVFASALNTIRGNLKMFPSAQPERKKGHWIRIAPRYYKCSECGVRVNSSFANFCHRCGSDMRGEKNGDIY